MTPDPTPTVADFAAWVANARSVLDDYVATDAQMVTVGLTLCQEVPVTWARADELTSGLGPSSVGLTAQNVMDLSGLAESTICPGGTVLPNAGAAGAFDSEPTPVALPKCPTMKQLKGVVRVVSSRRNPDIEGSRIWLLEIRVTNPRPYPVYLSGWLQSQTEFGQAPLLSPPDAKYVENTFDLPLKPGRNTIRTEAMDVELGEKPSRLTWKYWTVSPTEHVTDPDQPCEQVSSS